MSTEVWTVERNRGPVVDEIQCNDGSKAVAMVWTRRAIHGDAGKYETDPEGEARLRLMLAAPELLEALEALTANYDDVQLGESSNVDNARAAIAKAKGTPP